MFSFGLAWHKYDYTVAIDPVDDCYTPFSRTHSLTLLMYFILYHVSLGMIWIRGRKLPPLLLVLFLIFIIIGLGINFANIVQFSVHKDVPYEFHSARDDVWILFFPATIFSIIIAFLMISKIIREEKDLSEERHFRNRFLEKCNRFLSEKYSPLSWAFIFLLPVFVVVTIILILLGQDYGSLVKVYTETTTWVFSQK